MQQKPPNLFVGSVTGLFAINAVCPVCKVRFERQSGESVGGMYLNLGVAELLTIGGFFIVHGLFAPPFMPHLIFWVVFNIAFVLLFYRHARSMWVSVSYLTGGVQTDADYERGQATKPTVTSPYRDR